MSTKLRPKSNKEQGPPPPVTPAEPVPSDTTIPATKDPGQLLLSFSDAWRTADWAQMDSVATANVVATAKEWYEEGGYPNINDENLGVTLDGCFATATGDQQCQFLYAPAGDGFGLIFDLTYTDTDAGMQIVELSFGGDAG